MYPDLLSGEFVPTNQSSPESYPSLPDESSVDDLERFLDEPSNSLHQDRPSRIHDTDFLPVNVQVLSDGSFRCIWCNKTLYGTEQLEGHLTGKGHRSRLLNMDISPYGLPTHFEEVEEYVSNYGHNLYARLKHWPVCIEETATDWLCRSCGKRFQTHSAVNFHLKDVAHSPSGKPDVEMEEGGGYPELETWERPAHWPTCIVSDGNFWKCEICNKRFNNIQVVEIHLKHERHTNKLTESPTRVQMADATRPKPGGNQIVTLSSRLKAESKEMVKTLSQFIQFDERRCRLCDCVFQTLRETEEHADDLGHIGRYLQYTLSSEVI